MALIKDYFEKTKYYIEEYGEKSIVLMQVGAFFEVYGLKNVKDNSIYGSEIINFSKICDLNVVDKKVCVGSESVKMAGFKDMFLDKFVKKLQENGFTSIVFTQDENLTSNEITRSLLGIYSPGTYFACETEKINNNSCCIWLHLTKNSILSKNLKSWIYVGVAIIDIYTGKTSIFEFKEIYINNPTTFDELERIISSFNPSETILIANFEKNLVEDIINFTNIQSSSIHFVSLLDESNSNKNICRANNCEKQIYQKEILQKFYSIIDYSVFINPFYEKTMAIQSLCYLLDFIYQHNPNLVYKIKEPIFESLGDRLILANHSLKQLNIIEDQFKGKYSSVLKLLNECITNMGKRKFSELFLNPTTNEIYLNQEYNIIEYCLTKMEIYLKIKPMLLEISDLTKFHRQIIIKKITPKNIFQLYNSLQLIKQIYDVIIIDSTLHEYLSNRITDFKNLLDILNELMEFLTLHLDINLCQELDNLQKFEINFIKKGINSLLDEKTKNLVDSENILEACKNYFNELIGQYEKSNVKGKKTDLNFIKIHETEKNNFSLIATDRRCKILEELLKNKNQIKIKYFSNGEEKIFKLETNLEYIKHTASNKFITSLQINSICKNVSHLKTELMTTTQQVYLSIIEKLIGFQKQFDVISDFITLLDVIYTKATISKKYGYCKPLIIDAEKSFVNVKCLRHCLIEHIQQNELYVANDIQLGKGNATNEKECDGILLYGTNAVGKTSFIRSLGIATVMAQAGLYVPASSFIFKPYKYLFTRIIGNDNIFKGLSTFAVEMSELNTILRLANKNSLILGDELCSGTESISATSIFVAGIQQLAQIRSSFIFATHLHEIINYEEIETLQNVALKHMSVFYDKAKDLLVYDRILKDGPGDNMYGLEVCKSLNLPQNFLEEANKIRMKYLDQY